MAPAVGAKPRLGNPHTVGWCCACVHRASVASSALSEDAREPPPAETTQAAEPAKPFQLIDTEAVADKLQFKNPFPRIFKGPPPALQELTQKYAEWEEQASEKNAATESDAEEPEPDA